MKNRFWLGVLVGVLIGTMLLSEKSSFGEFAKKVFIGGRGAIAVGLQNIGKTSQQAGQGMVEQ